MLNEMISYMYRCPVCGRYHDGPLDKWWCPYCGPTLDTLTIQKLEKLTNRVDIIEALIRWSEITSLDDED